MQELNQQIAVVTGAGSGLGKYVAIGLANKLSAVILVGRRGDKLAEVHKAIQDAGHVAYAYPCDVSNPDAVEVMYKAIAEEWGIPSILINNAGVHTEMLPIQNSTPERWIETMSINVFGPYLLSRVFMGGMIKVGWGRIINFSSAAAFGAPGGVGSAYPLSKVALNHFTRQLATELTGTGVTANAIHPGEVKTEMWQAIRDDAQKRGTAGEGARNWAKMVEETGGDPPDKALELILEVINPSDPAPVNGQFLWIKDGIQAPKPTW